MDGSVAREVVWTEPAREDLAAIAAYIARDSEIYAANFVLEVRDAAASLSQFAERGHVVPEFGDATIRELLVRPYRVIYEVLDEKVLVLALVHGARRIGRV